MFNRKKIVAILICFITFCGISQNTKKDSLLNSIHTQEDDTNKVNALIALAAQYDYFNSKERIENYILALNLSKKLNFRNGIINISNRLITNLSHRQLYDVALEYCHNYIDYLHANKEDEELKKIYKLYATLLAKQGKYKESLEFNFKALNYYFNKHDEIQYATVLNNISILHLENKQSDSAYLYGLRALDIFKRNNKQSELANTILGLAEISYFRKDYNNAKLKAFESMNIYKAAKIDLGILNACYVTGNILLKQGKPDSAIYYYKNSLELLKKFSLPEINRDCYLSISKCYYELKQPDLAYANHILYSAYNDSVSDGRLRAKTLEMDAKYSITRKEGELKEKENVISYQNKQRNFLLAGLIGIITLLLILYRGYRQKKSANKLISEQKRLVDEKQKEIIDSIHYAQRIQQSLMPPHKYIENSLKKLKK